MTSTPPSPPLNCYTGLNEDDFAGWYAVNDKARCNDFCYWQQPDTYFVGDDNILSNDNDDNNSKTPYSTADPHQTTITNTNAKWTCLLNSAGDETSFESLVNAFDKTKTSTNEIKTFYDENIFKFDSLRCSRGAGEHLHSNVQEAMKSITFWSIVIVICLIFFMVQFFYGIKLNRKWKRMIVFQEVMNDNELQMRTDLQNQDDNDYSNSNLNRHSLLIANRNDDDNDGDVDVDVDVDVPVSQHQLQYQDDQNNQDEDNVLLNHNTPNAISYDEINTIDATSKDEEKIEMLSIINHDINGTSTQTQNAKCIEKKCCSKRQCFFIFMLAINFFFLYLLFTAILVTVEIDQKLNLPYPLQSLTPPCSDTELLCPIANNPIDNPSTTRAEALEGNNFVPFSYIIASDSQLDWYNGESAHIGTLSYPPACSSSDSCGSCTKKLGQYTNQQMKKSIEKLVQTKSNNDSSRARARARARATFNSNSISRIDTVDIQQPIPKTLIMNGDLTQYFHRGERKKYEAIYHNLDGLEQYFPSLGNHDYAQNSGATYSNDEWVGPHYCNGKHAVSYLKGAFCNKIPKFDAKERLTRYDPKSLSYSWEEGPYHFVQVHYYPLYENAGLGISSSLEWLERDLRLANENNLTSVLYVHASSSIPSILEETLLKNNVAVIFTGHIHRCLGRKCELVSGLNTYQAEKYMNETAAGNHTNATIHDRVERCFPSSAALCGRKADGNGLFYLSDMSPDLTLPKRKLISEVPKQKGLCPVGKYGPYLNETENTSLCKRISIPAEFPSEPKISNNNKTIPIFWSGSASFETFLVAEFHSDRIIVNVMTAAEGKEGERYVDTNTVPNAIYPFHTTEDMDEHTIFI